MKIPFGNRIELLVDDYLIAQKENLSFCLQEPKDCGKVISFTAPWEQPGSLGMTILEDDENIKCYYRGFPSVQHDDSDRQTSCLSVSDDGLHFTPYPVNEIPYDGITENNIIRMDTFCHNFAPFYDTNPNCKPDERYKAIGGIVQQGGIHVFASPDGIHWHLLADGPVITDGAFDSMNMAFWNPATGKYHCYFRYCYIPGVENSGQKMEYNRQGILRAIRSCTSEDFIHWTAPMDNQYAEGHPIDELYTNAARPIPGAEHILVSIPMRFQAYRKKLPEYDSNSWGSDGVSDAVLMTSRDGVYWNRAVKDAWLSGGLCEREWTQRNFIVCGGIIARDDNFYFYVEKHYMWDDCGIWAYSVPKYRLMSLYADGTGGSFTSNPLHFESDTISLNYKTSAYGYVRVTVRDMDGNAIYSSDEIYGNERSHTLTVDGLAGKDGTLFVELMEAHLYAIGAEMN